MPSWGDILTELRGMPTTPQGGLDYDSVRKNYMQRLHTVTGRAVILYSTAWMESRAESSSGVQLGVKDVCGLMEAVSNIEETELDLILHSPGGTAEGAESFVEYIRQRFDHIRAIVPVAAMSAATMVALSADELVMGQHSQLGPIDPQLTIISPEGVRFAPSQAILNQFEIAKRECATPSNLAAWMPILRTYAPGLLTQCVDSQKLAINMVSGWLERYMFDGDADAGEKSMEIAKWFADYNSFLSHGRRVGRDEIRSLGLKVVDLEDDDQLQDAVLSVHHASMHAFSGTPAVKIISNQHGRAWITMENRAIQVAQAVPAPNANAPVQQGQQPSRAERRRQNRGR